MSRKLEQPPNVILSLPVTHDGIIYLNKGFYGRFLAGVLYSFEIAVEKIRMAFYKNTRNPTIKYTHPPMKRESGATISIVEHDAGRQPYICFSFFKQIIYFLSK